MKICFVTTGDIKSIATAKRALGMANPLANLGWDVFILMEDTEENHHRVHLECSEKVNIQYFPSSNVRKEIAAKNKLIKRINPDFLYICAFVTRNVVGVFNHAIKLVEHSELQSAIPTVRGLHRLRILFFEYYSILYADALIYASKYLEKIYERRKKMFLCLSKYSLYSPYAYSTCISHVDHIDKKTFLGGRYKNRIIYCFLGSITANYGAFTIIHAIEIAKQKNPNILMLFLGKGPDYGLARKYVEEHNLMKNIHLMGYVNEEDISLYFSITDYFISPMNDSIQDWARCPSKLYMYLPYDKPIITCKIGEPFEVLQDKGIYYSPSSSEDLAAKMIELIESGRSVLGINASLHTWNYRVEEFNAWIKKAYKK